MKKIECPNCASCNLDSIGWDKYICQYCGTVVQEENGTLLRLEVCNKPTVRLYSQMIMPKYELLSNICDDSFQEYIFRNLVRGFENELQKCVLVREDYEGMRNDYILTAEVEVVRPSCSNYQYGMSVYDTPKECFDRLKNASIYMQNRR